MALPMMRHIFSAFGELRFHPLQTRLRARLGDELVVDSTAGMIIWEPKRVVPVYAAPVDDLTATLATGCCTRRRAGDHVGHR